MLTSEITAWTTPVGLELSCGGAKPHARPRRLRDASNVSSVFASSIVRGNGLACQLWQRISLCSSAHLHARSRSNTFRSICKTRFGRRRLSNGPWAASIAARTRLRSTFCQAIKELIAALRRCDDSSASPSSMSASHWSIRSSGTSRSPLKPGSLFTWYAAALHLLPVRIAARLSSTDRTAGRRTPPPIGTRARWARPRPAYQETIS